MDAWEQDNRTFTGGGKTRGKPKASVKRVRKKKAAKKAKRRR
jgi:hypothetical protein